MIELSIVALLFLIALTTILVIVVGRRQRRLFGGAARSGRTTAELMEDLLAEQKRHNAALEAVLADHGRRLTALEDEAARR